ncbi:YeeE/YedE thiosulfate transporter family protein [Ferrovibrio terrae]|uniref:YeeE/YedE thiosulfate transporter family protein n=1 Tax=Ferrovibrio terrae TaxID=2594003 RepID=UPI0031379ADF
MSVLSAIFVGLAMGLVFGLALEKSRVFEPGVIVGQMQLRNFIMLKVFLSAVATGLVVLAALNGFGFIKLAPKATLYTADIAGGLILGVGITLAGGCPGTVLAQIGAGYRDAWATLLGGLCGALTFGYLEPVLRPWIDGGPGKLTLDHLVGLPFWQVAVMFAALIIMLLVLLERWRPWQTELGRHVDGDTGSAATGGSGRRHIVSQH